MTEDVRTDSILMTWYERLKSVLWPNVLGPLGVIVAIDYLVLVGWIAQVVLTAYVMLHLLSYAAGIAVGTAVYLDPQSKWAQIYHYNLVKVFPLVNAGGRTVSWLMRNEKPTTEVQLDRAP